DLILAEVVKNTSKKEGYNIEEGGAELLALIGDGSFRDTLSTLDKVLSFAKGKSVTIGDITSVTGAPEVTLVEDFISAIANSDIEKGYETIRNASMQNIDMKIYIKMILSTLRYTLMLRYAPNTKNKITESLSAHDMEFIGDIVKNKPEFITSRTLSILLQAYQNLRYAFIAELPLELALVDILKKDISV
ncbi:hypothetical protein IT400_04380, partial [Candidatus Nomurabacteria bacterium]|nr:hypothetical protein [Candidatus Nomurabacteria bacterium]